MSLAGILAVICIALGLIGAIIEEKLLLGALEWFVVSIAFSMARLDFTFGKRP